MEAMGIKLLAGNALAQSSFLTPKEIVALQAVGFAIYADLLMHLPKRHEDRRKFEAFPLNITTQAMCLRGFVIDARPMHYGSGFSCYECVMLDRSGGVFGSGK